MQNQQINGLSTNHCVVPLLEKKQMRTLDVKEMESSSKIDLRDVLWRMYIKDACRFGKKKIYLLNYGRKTISCYM